MSLIRSLENSCLAKGGICVGKGWVGQDFSPSSFANLTGISSIGYIGSPVSLSKTNKCPDFVTCVTALSYFHFDLFQPNSVGLADPCPTGHDE